VTQPQAGPSEARSVLTQHDNVLATVPVLEADINFKPVAFNRDGKAHPIHRLPTNRLVNERKLVAAMLIVMSRLCHTPISKKLGEKNGDK
jgi:hypothetical protein